MRIFAIREKSKGEENLAFLLYYEIEKKFYIEIPDNVDEWQVPILLSSFVKKGQFTVGAHWSKLWVQQRIVPTDRQNLGQILRDNKLKNYDEFKLLMLGNGRCAQDDYYLFEIDKEDMPKFIKKRFDKRIVDVFPLNNLSVLVFFRNGITKKCNLEPIIKDRTFGPVRSNQKIFKSVSLETDGYGICWGENLTIMAENLYEIGVKIPLELDDFSCFVDRRVVSTIEAAKILNCSRQNIDSMVKKGKISPIKSNFKNRLFLKSDVERQKWQ